MAIRPVPVILLAGAGALALAAGTLLPAETSSAASRIPPPPAEKSVPSGDQVAVLAGGCFWGIEGLYEHVRGVKSVTSGYAGGKKSTANYGDVSSEKTGHAEAVRIVYDPAKVSYGTLLQIYFSVAHDPTQVNRQYPDVGPSYRSAIFPQNVLQRATAQAYIAKLTKAKSFPKPIATKLESGAFYPAEAYHQDFMRKNPQHPYIARWDKPKLAAFRKEYPSLYRN
ncbi:peptide-methionine (S)-S-oxide reductase MsrA [Novosphingobium pentaromativorans]|uniref:Peptide methionine sulfoxide reductase MsrA n=1 Tax=Novosphingobium pentaromativorans US6-1 TaxID=1088721 RepID=G6EA47_9SPHN|nr:peptide-methionine (S)-S-oxide reductase MsrA [Novosphingobium pentaromativorans]AIT80810.1 methionine sulfoxide reductase A [Novosphingobium pentaromativorans US6-1]EHJ61904.1 methionine sulfoxide reductase A [Novosphingobium pentaromativorans US6-1]